MNHFGFRLLAINTRTFRAGTWVFLFWLAVSNLAANSNLSAVSNLSAAPCIRSSTQQDSWVAERVNALVHAARAAYENHQARQSYERVLDKIAGMMKQCRLTEDRDFVGRYPELVEYVKLLSLSRQDDHELGFEVSDQVYFAETRSYTAIPDFLLTPRFLRSASRFETLPQAKALL